MQKIKLNSLTESTSSFAAMVPFSRFFFFTCLTCKLCHCDCCCGETDPESFARQTCRLSSAANSTLSRLGALSTFSLSSREILCKATTETLSSVWLQRPQRKSRGEHFFLISGLRLLWDFLSSTKKPRSSKAPASTAKAGVFPPFFGQRAFRRFHFVFSSGLHSHLFLSNQKKTPLPKDSSHSQSEIFYFPSPLLSNFTLVSDTCYFLLLRCGGGDVRFGTDLPLLPRF